MSIRRVSHLSLSFSLRFYSSSSSTGNELISVTDYLLHRYQFSPEAVAKLPSSSVKYLKYPEKSDSILSFLKESGFSRTHLERIVICYPKILSADLDRTIKPKIDIFQNLDFSPTDIIEIFLANPWIFRYSAHHRIRPTLLMLKNVLGSTPNVSRLLKSSGVWSFCKDLERTMIPNIEILKSCGVPLDCIVKHVYYFPRFLLLKPEIVKESAKRVDEIGVDRKGKMYLYAVRIVSLMSSEYLQLKWELFRSLGFSDNEITLLFRKLPQVFVASDSKIKETLQILRSTGKVDNSMIVTHPMLLLYSVERRIKPRIRLLEVLESKNLLRKQPRLSKFCAMPNKEFLNKYVLPYSNELGKRSTPFSV